MTPQNPFVVITSINGPTRAVSEFARWIGWRVIVVGDRKTPSGWEHENVTYLGIERQYDELGALARAIPENTYARKTLGYVYAIRNGATAIFETDDDNIPYKGAASLLDAEIAAGDRLTGDRVRSKNGWVNIYKCFGAQACWPRGFPLELIRDPASDGQPGVDGKPWAITQFLADEDPDVDAIYRMVSGAPVYFARERSFILDEGVFCPFNSQATLWLPMAFPLMFLPLGTSDRVTDILRGFMALACLWKSGRSLRYSSPVVYQKRNEHVLAKDFDQESALYAHSIAWSRVLTQLEGPNAPDFMASAIRKLMALGSIGTSNIGAYELFLCATRAYLDR